MKKPILKLMVSAILLLPCTYLNAQTDSLSKNIEEISLEDLMNVKIVSASRKEENSFEAPLSSCAITRKDIEVMGATSIPDALKVCPGLIVREMSNGTYDVAIRGFENLPTHEIQTNNKLLLVMIDNRPVFNHFQGGTYWENLPIDLIDVERIEVVNGPSSPLYGPNAVTGVINIITRKPSKDGLYATGTGQYGVTNTAIGQAAVGYQPNNKFSILGSVNYQKRDRFDVTMYNTSTSTFLTTKDEILANPTFAGEFNNRINKASERFGANLFANYAPNKKVNIALSGGLNNADALKSLTSSSNLAYYFNRSYYGNLKAEAYNVGLQVSYLSGTQRLTRIAPQYQYDYNTLDLYLDYNLKLAENFSIRPAISYQNAVINDLPYTIEKGITSGLFTNKANMTDLAGSLKLDYTLKKKLRIVGAVRADKFKSPDDIYLSYQGIVNYMPSDKHNIRFIAARSNSGSFLVNSDVNLEFAFGQTFIPPFGNVPIVLDNVGSKDYKLLQNDMYELGYRVKIVKNIQLDLALFNQNMRNFSTSITNSSGFNPASLQIRQSAQFGNLPTKAVQNGMTLALNILALNSKLNVKPSVTLQETTLYDYTPYYSIASVNPVYNTSTTVTKFHKGSPSAFGSLFVSYQPIKKLSIGVTAYVFDKSTMYGFTSTATAPGYTQHNVIANISGKFMANIKVAYKVVDRLSVFVNCRNVFNNNKVEFYSTDRIGALYMGGLTFEY